MDNNQESPRSSPLPNIEFRDPARELSLHPLLKRLPEPDYTSPQWEAFIVGMSSAGPEGVPPLFITNEGLVMVGGGTFLAAKRLQWAGLPCIVRPEWEAAPLIIDSLIAERSLTQGGKAYLSLTILREFIQGAENRRLHNLKNGDTTLEKPLILPKCTQCTDESDFDGWDPVAERLGVSRRLLYQAISIRKAFDLPALRAHKFEFQDGRELTLKEYFEPKILDPESPMGLGSVLKGIGEFVEDGKPVKRPPPARNSDLFYWRRNWQKMGAMWNRWEGLDEAGRELARQDVDKSFAAMSAELRREIIQTGRAVEKRLRKQARRTKGGKP